MFEIVIQPLGDDEADDLPEVIIDVDLRDGVDAAQITMRIVSAIRKALLADPDVVGIAVSK